MDPVSLSLDSLHHDHCTEGAASPAAEGLSATAESTDSSLIETGNLAQPSKGWTLKKAEVELRANLDLRPGGVNESQPGAEACEC